MMAREPSGPLRIRAYDSASDEAWAGELLETEFGGRLQARRGVLVDPLEGEGLVADADGGRLGVITWHLDGADRSVEIRLLVVVEEARGTGIGSALLRAALARLREIGAHSAWLVTTNDATDALAFYQRNGLRLSALRPGAVDEARRTLKGSIGRTGFHGIPIRDELELRIDFREESRG